MVYQKAFTIISDRHAKTFRKGRIPRLVQLEQIQRRGTAGRSNVFQWSAEVVGHHSEVFAPSNRTFHDGHYRDWWEVNHGEWGHWSRWIASRLSRGARKIPAFVGRSSGGGWIGVLERRRLEYHRFGTGNVGKVGKRAI